MWNFLVNKSPTAHYSDRPAMFGMRILFKKMNVPVVSCRQAGGWTWRGLALALLLSHQGATLCYGAGTAAAWGDNNAGQVSPIPSAALSGVTTVAGGGSHSLALLSDGTVVAWGWDNYGQVDVPSYLANATAISAGSLQSMALEANGTVVTWGMQETLPNGLTNIIAIAAGGEHDLAVRKGGTVVAWGDNTYGQTNVPPGLSNVVAVAAGDYFSMALQSDGTVVVWGDNTYFQTNVPPMPTPILAIAAGGGHCLALAQDGTVTAWGRNDFGQATPPANLTNAVAIAGGALHSLALTINGSLVGWGDDNYGQCDVGSAQLDYCGVGAGDYHSLTIRGNGSPVVLLQPASQTVAFGSPVTFQTLVVGTPPMAFQWQKNGRKIAGATTNSYALPSVQLTDGGTFTLVISNFMGTTTSKGAVLTPVGIPPWIVVQPIGLTNLCGQTANFEVTAGGVEPLGYQWVFQGLPILGATQTNLLLANVSGLQAGDYAVVVTNSYGSVTSATANLGVIVTPGITNQPQDLAAYCGEDATFQVGAGGPSPLSYQWLYQGTPIAGATAMLLDLPAVTNQQAGAYSVAVACPCGSVTSLVANLTVLGIPLVTNPPQDALVFCGDPATFQVGATGPTPLTYQWLFQGAPIPNATNATLGLVGVTEASAGQFSAVVSCPCGSITSSVASLILSNQPPLITSPLAATALQGQPFAYTITGLHNPLLYKAEVLPPGLTLNATNGIISGTNLESGTFYIQLATLNACAGDSQTLTLVVSSGAPVITSARSASGVAGTAFTYTITATQSPTTYSAQGLPPGVIVNPLTGVISGTPSYEGNFTATISASNPWGTGSAVLVVSIGYGQITGLSIVNVHTNYSKPYLLDVQFGLRDNNDPTNGNALVVDPSLLSVAAFEDTNQVDTTETALILKRVVPGSLTVEVNLVLDFSENLSSITVNGDSYGDGISDAVHAEISSAELFVTQLPASSRIGVYEFHRKDEAPNKVIGLTNQTAAFNAIAGIWTNYINFDTSTTRAWDALVPAIQTLGPANSSQLHGVIIVSDGNDNSSIDTVAQVITAATNANVQVYCLGFGQNINTNILQQIALTSGGLFYAGDTAPALAGEFAQVGKVFTGLYRLRWVTPKLCGGPTLTFMPSFSVTYQGLTAYSPTNPTWVSNYTVVSTNIDSTQTPPVTNVVTNAFSTNVTNFIYFSPYNVCSNAGNVQVGLLNLQPNSALPSGVSLYASYLPEYIRQFYIHYRLNWPGTVVPATNLTDLLSGWSAVPTSDGSNGTWLLLSSPDPYSPQGVQITSLPWGDWGSLVDFNFRDAISTNLFTSNLTAFAFFVVNTNIYSNNIPGYFGQTMSNNVSGMVTNLPVLPYGTPAAWLIANGFTTPSAWTNDETLDSDGDGMLNWQEYQANTNPNDPKSRLAITSVVQSTNDGRWQLTFRSALNRDYQVQATTNLFNWRVVQDGITGTGTNITVIDATFVPSSQTFYRLMVDPY
jgi:alpha-tubulin suppressor-like RCC1 family protein